MGGQVQQTSNASHYDHHLSSFPGLHSGEVADAAMARWLQSAGLQHLASPTASPSMDPRLLPNMLMQVSSLFLMLDVTPGLLQCRILHRCRSHVLLFRYEFSVHDCLFREVTVILVGTC